MLVINGSQTAQHKSFQQINNFQLLFCVYMDHLVDCLVVLSKTAVLVDLFHCIHLALSHCELKQKLSMSLFFVFELY